MVRRTRSSRSRTKSKSKSKTRRTTTYAQIKEKLDEIDKLARQHCSVPDSLSVLEPDRVVTHTPEINQPSTPTIQSAQSVQPEEMSKPKRASRPPPPGLAKFNEFIKGYHKNHPELSYTDALMEGSAIWRQRTRPPAKKDSGLDSDSEDSEPEENMPSMPSMPSMQGNTGSQGSQGSQDSQGSQGSPSNTGSQGSAGNTGSPSNTGSPGNQKPASLNATRNSLRRRIPTLVPDSMRLKQKGPPEDFD